MAHTLDNSFYWGGNNPTNPYTTSYTCGAGATLLVFSLVYDGRTDLRPAGAPTYNNVSMTQVDIIREYTSSETAVEMWYLSNPSNGTYTFSYQQSVGRLCYLVLSSYKASTGYTSIFNISTGNATSGSNPSCNVITTQNNCVLVAVLGSGYLNKPTGCSHTSLYSTDRGSRSDSHQYALQSTAGSISLSWTCPTDDWCMIVGAWAEKLLGYTHSVNGVAGASIASINGLATANIAKVNGV
jgi:hypothetical protein